MDKCEKCGFLECRCPDHVAQNYVPKSDLRKVVEEFYEGKIRISQVIPRVEKLLEEK